LLPSIKATVSSHPSPCALIPWSLPNIKMPQPQRKKKLYKQRHRGNN
jgi:hypothetical protein